MNDRLIVNQSSEENIRLVKTHINQTLKTLRVGLDNNIVKHIAN